MLLTQEKWPEFVRRDEQFGPIFSFQPVLISPLSKKTDCADTDKVLLQNTNKAEETWTNELSSKIFI